MVEHRNKKRISIALGLFGIILIIFSILGLALQINSSMMRQGAYFLIIDGFVNPLFDFILGLYLILTKKKLLTYFIKEYDSEYKNFAYSVVVFIGCVYLVLGIRDVLAYLSVNVLGSFFENLIMNVVSNYAYGDIEINTPIIYIIVGIGLVYLSPTITKLIIRNVDI